jgi:replication factor A1
MAATPAGEELPEVRLRDVGGGLSAQVHVVGKVVSARRREVVRRSDGGRRPLLFGLLSDGSASVRFTWWDPPREGIERGTILRAVGAEVREFRGRVELVFTWKTRVGPAGPAELPRLDGDRLPLCMVRDLKEGNEGFRLEARVLSVQAKPVNVGEERRIVHEGLLADATGAMSFASWSDFALAPGEAVRISGGYVRAFRGRRQLVLDERGVVVRIEPTGLPELAEWTHRPARPIADVEEEGGGEATTIEGVVVGVLPPSGLVHRCPECRRLVTGGLCRVHGRVTGVADLRARLVLDDGTGAATVAAGREATERLWGITLEDARERLRGLPDASVLEEQLLEAVVGRRLVVRGSATRDDFGLTVTPETIEPAEIDLEAAADELAARLHGAR